MDSRPRIVMIGPAPGGAGAISATVEIYAAHGLFQRWDAVYLPTHRNGNKARKAAVALGAWTDLIARLAIGRVALLHVHLPSSASVWRKALFILPAYVLGVGYVLHLHGRDFIDFYRERLGLARGFIRFLLRHAERVIALSPEWREALAALEPASRVVVIPNPVEVPAWHASLDAPPPTVLFLGGPGEGDEILALARSLGAESSMRVLGWIEGEAKEALLRKAWVLAVPSHVEALPMAVLEAQAAGIPVVAERDVAALSRALVSLVTDAALRKAMGRAARERAVADYSSEVIVPRIEAVWREIVPQQEVISSYKGTRSPVL